MRISVILLFGFFLQVSAAGWAQKVSVKETRTTYKELFQEVERQTGLITILSNDEMDINQELNIQEGVFELKDLYQLVLEDADMEFRMIDGYIVIKPSGRSAIAAEGPKDDMQAEVKHIITGKVTDSETGEPLVGVNVIIKGTTLGTITDANGNYTLTLPEGTETVVFSFIGMISQEAQVYGRSTINIALVSDSQGLDEVVVTGYQTISKERASGAYVKVSNDVLEQRPLPSVADALDGLVTGLQKRGDDYVIRGIGTFDGSTSPLVVIDGFMIQSDNAMDLVNPTDIQSVDILKDAAATSIYGARAANGVIVITTKRAAKGKLNVTFDSFMSVSEMIDLDHAMNMANTTATIQYMEDVAKYTPTYGFARWTNPYNNPSNPFYNVAPHVALTYELNEGNISQAEYDSQKQALINRDGIYKQEYEKHLLRNAMYQQHSLTITSGTDKGSSKFNVMYANDKTSYQYNNKDKFLLNFDNVYNLNDKITTGISFNGILNNDKMNGTNVSAMKGWTSPYTRLIEDDGSYSYLPNGIYLPYLQNGRIDESEFPYSWRYNPLEEARNSDNNTTRFNARLSGYVDLKIIKGLSARLSGQYELAGNTNKDYIREGQYQYRSFYNTISVLNPETGLREMPSKGYIGSIYDADGNRLTSAGYREVAVPQETWLRRSGSNANAWNVRGQLNFDREFGGIHRVTAIGGFELTSRTNVVNGASLRPGFNEVSHTLPTNIDFSGMRFDHFFGGYQSVPWYIGGVEQYDDRYASAYGNLAYTYNSKYTLTGSFRVDGSNFVAESVNNKLSPFWSVGGVWNVDQESFISDNAPFIDYLMLKSSYGVGGNAVGRSAASTLTTLGSWYLNSLTGGGLPYSYINTVGDPNLTWEKAYTFNVSADYSMFNRKLRGSIGYYNKLTKDALMSVPVSYAVAGRNQIKQNAGEISNKGIELSIGTNMRIANNISWTGDLNFTYNKNEVMNWDIERPYVNNYIYGSYPIKGKPLGTVYAYNVVGYSDEGFGIIRLNDGTEVIADSRANTKYYSLFNEFGNPDASVTNDNGHTQEVGVTQAPMFGGFRNNFKVKNFTFSFIMTGEFGHIFQFTDDYGYSGTSHHYSKSLESAWRAGDDQSKFIGRPYPDEVNGPTFNSGALSLYYSNFLNASKQSWYNASNIRLREVFLGYDIPVRVLGNKVKRLNVYVQARNLGTLWTANDKGLDPLNLPGSVRSPRTYTFGLKVNL